MSKAYLIPTLGEPMPYPGGTLPAEGDFIETIDTFWRRRLKHGDVAVGKPPKAPAATTPPAGDGPSTTKSK